MKRIFLSIVILCGLITCINASRYDYGFTPKEMSDYYNSLNYDVAQYSTAPVKGDGSTIPELLGSGIANRRLQVSYDGSSANRVILAGAAVPVGPTDIRFSTVTTGLYADLASATAASINSIRLAFQTQRLLERDARGGTRYIEMIFNHYGVINPDFRLQRPEFLGSSKQMVNIHPIAQTSNTPASGTPQGNLAAIGTLLANRHGFSQSFTEHGYVIGLVSLRADLTYQQGLRRMWSRSTRYDFYFPAFAMLGEQAVLRKEIFVVGDPGNDDLVFGYQERWAEYRYAPSMVTGLFRSTSAGTLDAWHLAQKFTSLPVLGDTFIQENPPLSRILAVGSGANGAQFIFDSFFDMKVARPMPLYSVPGLIDHF